ncbi:cupin domain-containing protein [Hymenobacter cellulosivorans]|uniref:Cupin domain-containing protein n=1 Tax=Hymenobacter cellulosivorans TaxID=2932249 RepID=A0ABY4FFC3_9BACT|nr:cupin domain-containing protein [Hymenobacter cellulosivorans]UOQ55213.1 cupin domain-containing protein [Hymenobacter cellulosivorans]
MDTNKQAPTILAPTEGQTLAVMGSNYRILASGQDTAGAYATIDMLVPPGGGPGPHAHADIEETFFVVEGEVEVKSEFGTTVATAGSYIRIPKGGVVHGFKNKSAQPARLLCTVVPAGLDEFFQEIGQPVAPGQFLPPPVLDQGAIQRIQALAQAYGQQVFPPNYLG